MKISLDANRSLITIIIFKAKVKAYLRNVELASRPYA